MDEDQNTLIIELATGLVAIELLPDVAPLHVERIKTLTRAGEYDNVAFHRVIDGFVAQTGDVEFGDLEDGYNPQLVGTGNSDLPDLPLEPSEISFERGVVGMARAQALDSANSQFFITYDDATFLDGAYTVFGVVVEGMELVDGLERGAPGSGRVADPDRMIDVELAFGTPSEGFALGLSSDEAQEIALLYEAGLDRDGGIDLDGLNFWIDAREGEGAISVREAAQYFLDSPEFVAAYGEPETLGDQEFVELLYLNVLDRPGEDAGVAFWTGVLGQPDFSQADLLYEFAISVENAQTMEFLDTLAEVAPGDWAFL